MAEKNMKVLLIDDHPLILSAIRHVIRDLSKDVVVVGWSLRWRPAARCGVSRTSICCCWT